MDLFQEARWTFTAPDRVQYYQTIQDLLIAPRLPRFGILRSACAEACAFVLSYRTDPQAIGYPAAVANPLALLADVGDLEYNDPCRICIESNYTATIQELHASIPPTFSYLHQQVLRARNALDNNEENKDAWIQLDEIATNLAKLTNGTVSADDVVDFYSFYVARELYGELGVEAYMENYALFNESITSCQAFGGWLSLTCPLHPSKIDTAMATKDLLNHADNVFSSVTTSGAPFPFWSEPDGTGSLLKANNVTGSLYPVGGSGINMSAPLWSLTSYFAYLYLQRELVDPSVQAWQDMVATNPLYAWLMADLTAAKEGTGRAACHCRW